MNISSVLIAFCAAAVITVVVAFVLRAKGLIGFRPEQVVQDAIEEGRYATAYLIKVRRIHASRGDFYDCKYVYAVKGVDYFFHLSTEHKPSQEFTVYYEDRYPDRAFYQQKPDIKIPCVILSVIFTLTLAIALIILTFSFGGAS